MFVKGSELLVESCGWVYDARVYNKEPCGTPGR